MPGVIGHGWRLDCQTASRVALQRLVERINEQDFADMTPPQVVAESWRVISEYISNGLEIYQSERLDWQRIAQAEVHLEGFERKLQDLAPLGDRWAAAFPLKEFCETWDSAWQEFVKQLSERQISVTRDIFELALSLLSSDAPSSPESLIASNVSVIGHSDPAHRVYGYHTGCDDTLPEELPGLQLRMEVSGVDNPDGQSLLESQRQTLLKTLLDARGRYIDRLAHLSHDELNPSGLDAMHYFEEDIDVL